MVRDSFLCGSLIRYSIDPFSIVSNKLRADCVAGSTNNNVPHFTTARTNATSAINPTPAPLTAKILSDF